MAIIACLDIIIVNDISLILYKKLLFDKSTQSYCLAIFYEIGVKLDTDLKKSIKNGMP